MDYIQGQQIIGSLKIVNDTVENGIQLIDLMNFSDNSWKVLKTAYTIRLNNQLFVV